MRKLVSFMHVSLDGFVAGPNGEMDWINVEEEMFDYAGRMTDRSDLALYGRNTFDMMEGYWPTAADQPNASKHDIQHSTWYKQVSKIVISKTLKGKSLPNTRVISDNFSAEINKIKEQKGNEIVIFGSPGTTHTLMALDLIDAYWIFLNPVLIGKGIPLFKNISEIQKLKLVESVTLTSGVVVLHYERVR